MLGKGVKTASKQGYIGNYSSVEKLPKFDFGVNILLDI
jgi:hypothetical protein